MNHNLEHAKLIVPVIDLAHVEGTISNLADILPALRVNHLDVEIQIVGSLPIAGQNTLGEILTKLTSIKGDTKKTMADVSNLSTAFTKFAGDFSTFKTDLTAFLGTLKPEDPAVQTAIDGFTASLGTMDTDVQGMDASLKPAASAAGPVA